MTTRQRKRNTQVSSNREYEYHDGGASFAQIMKNTVQYERRHRVLYGMPFGPQRRQELLKIIPEMGGLHVNRRWCPQLKYDPDLTKLLKSGKLVRTREGSFGCKHTVLRVA